MAARSCGSKLYYRKLRYPSLSDDDPYLEFLADGGYMVKKWRSCCFQTTNRSLITTTRTSLLPIRRRSFFEATIIHGNCLARVDVLQKNGTDLIVMEVKSGSFDSGNGIRNSFRGARGNILSEYRAYLEDLTFKCTLIRRAFPRFSIFPRLCLIDKSRKATENSTFDKFRLTKIEELGRGHWARIEYLGDVDRLQSEHVLVSLDASSEVWELEPEVADASARLEQITPEIGQKCKKCEYRLPQVDGQPNGFLQCWGELAGARREEIEVADDRGVRAAERRCHFESLRPLDAASYEFRTLQLTER